MSAVLAVLAMAVLFAAFGFVRLKPGCSGHCGDCADSCRLRESIDENT